MVYLKLPNLSLFREKCSCLLPADQQCTAAGGGSGWNGKKTFGHPRISLESNNKDFDTETFQQEDAVCWRRTRPLMASMSSSAFLAHFCQKSGSSREMSVRFPVATKLACRQMKTCLCNYDILGFAHRENRRCVRESKNKTN